MNIERLLSAILLPTFEAMKVAGIRRFSIERDGSAVIQMEDGPVFSTPEIKAKSSPKHENVLTTKSAGAGLP